MWVWRYPCRCRGSNVDYAYDHVSWVLNGQTQLNPACGAPYVDVVKVQELFLSILLLERYLAIDCIHAYLAIFFFAYNYPPSQFVTSKHHSA